jgi:hypothetical protein
MLSMSGTPIHSMPGCAGLSAGDSHGPRKTTRANSACAIHRRMAYRAFPGALVSKQRSVTSGKERRGDMRGETTDKVGIVHHLAGAYKLASAAKRARQVAVEG